MTIKRRNNKEKILSQKKMIGSLHLGFIDFFHYSLTKKKKKNIPESLSIFKTKKNFQIEKFSFEINYSFK